MLSPVQKQTISFEIYAKLNTSKPLPVFEYKDHQV